MTFFIIRTIGDFSRPDEVRNFDGEVAEENGKFFVTVEEDGGYLEKEEVYLSKKEAWKVILKRIDDYLADMRRKRDIMFTQALEDGAFQQTPEEFKKWIENIRGIQDEETTNLFEKRNKVK
jgi:hypothetical protein